MSWPTADSTYDTASAPAMIELLVRDNLDIVVAKQKIDIMDDFLKQY